MDGRWRGDEVEMEECLERLLMGEGRKVEWGNGVGLGMLGCGEGDLWWDLSWCGGSMWG